MLRLQLMLNDDIVGFLDICNTGTGTEQCGNYAIGLLDKELHPLRHCELERYPRRFGAWELVRQALGVLWELDKTGFHDTRYWLSRSPAP